MVSAVYIIKMDPHNSNEVECILKMVTGRTKYQSGCIKSEIWKNSEMSEIMLKELWNTEQDIKKHISSPLYKRLLEALELSAGQPEIRFCDCKNIRGLEFIEKVFIQNPVRGLFI